MPEQLNEDERLLIELNTQLKRALQDIKDLSSEMKTYPAACRKELYQELRNVEDRVNELATDFIKYKKNGNGISTERSLLIKIIFELTKVLGIIAGVLAIIYGSGAT